MILFSVFRYFLLICFVFSYHKVDSPDYPLTLTRLYVSHKSDLHQYFETRKMGLGRPPPPLVPVSLSSKTFLLARCKVTYLITCSQGFDGIFSVADPLLLQFSGAECRFCWSFPVQAHVWTFVVVEVDSCL